MTADSVITIENDNGTIKIKGTKNPRSNTRNKAVACQVTECRTKDDKICHFPFRYKNRLYSSCITLDSETSWCSLNTDSNYNHIDDGTSRGECQDTCHILNCPIGFFYQNNNCYHISAMTSNDYQYSQQGAESICHNLGSRLYQPRDYNLDGDLLKSEENFFKELFHSLANKPQFLAIGAKTSNFPSTGEVYYNDGTRAYYLESVIALQGGLTSTYIPDLASIDETICIFMTAEARIVAEQCNGFDGNKPLGFICEAKPLITKDGLDVNKACHFPFRLSIDDVELYHSCIYNKTARYSWCFTELDSEGVGIPGKTGICPDEREITYDGPGGGKECHLPFLSERVWYDQCAIEPREEIWCPTRMANPNLMFDENIDEYGYCTGYLASANPNCNANYDFIGGKCIRVSPFPETFEAASLKCRSEGSFLLTILQSSVMPPIKSHIEVISKSKIQFLPKYSPDISTYWVGGVVTNSIWSWEANGKNFSLYSNWLDKKENEGCVLNQCTNNYRLSVEVNKNYAWKAADKNLEKPYICESKCQAGFLWFKGAKKCLKVESKSVQASIGESIYQCSKYNARLISFDSCESAENLAKDFKRMLTQKSDELWIGLFSNGLDNLFPRRLSEESKSSHPVIRSDGYAAIKDCAYLPDTSETDAQIGFFEYVKPTITLQHIEIDTSEKKGYICEQDFDWSCPPEYIKFQEDCYKISDTQNPFTDSLIKCREENGILVEVSTDLHKLLFVEMAKHKNVSNTNIWTGYRKDPPNVAENPNKMYHSTTHKEVTLNSATGLLHNFHLCYNS